MKYTFVVAGVAALVCGSAALVIAQDAEPDQPPAPTSDTEVGAPPPADDVFVPSEEVQAADELVFPVNI